MSSSSSSSTSVEFDTCQKCDILSPFILFFIHYSFILTLIIITSKHLSKTFTISSITV
jgi:hypothetical protein